MVAIQSCRTVLQDRQLFDSERKGILTDTIDTADVIVSERIRREAGDIEGLSRSIKEFGLIQPLVVAKTPTGEVQLVAGGRRLASLTKLGVKQLVHGTHFIYRGEEDAYTRKAVELEENLRRQDLNWYEVVLAKQQLLDLMIAKHGAAKLGPPTRAERADPSLMGFGVRKLAEMLGESASTTSNDLQVASIITKFPSLKTLPTKKDAMRRMNVATTIVGMQASASATSTASAAVSDAPPGTAQAAPTPEKPWKLYKGDFRVNCVNVTDASVDLVLTDLPYAIGLGDGSAAHSAGLSKFVDRDIDIDALCTDVAFESFRVLKNNRFAVFFFGANYFVKFYDALTQAGFSVDDYWFIWRRNRTAPPSPGRYAKVYDPALICQKGSPTLLRPNLGNFIDIPSVSGDARLHSAQKPDAVMAHFVLDMTAQGATVVDWFAGAGATGVASVKNKRKAILFELEESSCSIIIARMDSIK
jgi:ParB/RepB/Spo0J family partition protein